MQEERVLRRVDVGEYPLDLVPLEKDVLSLELDGLFRRVSRKRMVLITMVVFGTFAAFVFLFLCQESFYFVTLFVLSALLAFVCLV